MEEASGKEASTNNYSRQAKRRWPYAEWIEGNGRYACIARCGGVTSVSLFDALAGAEEAKASIEAMAVAVGAARTI